MLELTYPTLVHTSLYLADPGLSLDLTRPVARVKVQSMVLFKDMNDYQSQWERMIAAVYSDILYLYSTRKVSLELFDYGEYLIRKIDNTSLHHLDYYSRTLMKTET